MPEEPAKLDETLDAKPYEPPKRQGGRWRPLAWIGLALLLVISGTLILRATSYGPKVDLRLKFKPGQTFRYEVSGQLNLEVETTGTKSTIANSTTFSATYEVVSVDENGDYSVKMRVKSIAFSAHSPAMVNWPAQDIDYDSDKLESKGKNKTLAETFGSLMLAEVFSARVSPTGKIIESSGMEKIQKQLLAAFPDAAERIESMTGSNTTKSLWAVFCERPQEAIKSGGSWPIERAIGGVMRLTVKAKLDKVENGQANVRMAGLDTAFGDFAEPRKPSDPDAALARDIKVTKSEIAGATHINLSTGAITSADSTVTVEYGLPDSGSRRPISYRWVSKAAARLLPMDDGNTPVEK